jgi:hypothetical protein
VGQIFHAVKICTNQCPRLGCGTPCEIASEDKIQSTWWGRHPGQAHPRY